MPILCRRFPKSVKRCLPRLEIGESFGKVGMGLLIFIYSRTLLKLILGQGKLAQRLLPNYISPIGSSILNQLLAWLNRTHVYFGIAAIAVILLPYRHSGLLPLQSYFFLSCSTGFSNLARCLWVIPHAALFTSRT